VAALNDPTRTQIGNPWRGIYGLSVAANDWEADLLVRLMRELVIDVRVNVSRRNSTQSQRYLAVYDIDSLGSLLSTIGDQLNQPTRLALDVLVRARGPVPEHIVSAIRQKRDVHRFSFAQIAHLMNDMQIVDGMGGRGWTLSKVRAAYRRSDPRTPSAATEASEAAEPLGPTKASA
jgi:hypothetical protein